MLFRDPFNLHCAISTLSEVWPASRKVHSIRSSPALLTYYTLALWSLDACVKVPLILKVPFEVELSKLNLVEFVTHNPSGVTAARFDDMTVKNSNEY